MTRMYPLEIRMLTGFCCLLFALLSLSMASADTNRASSTIPDLPFPMGEHLNYRLYWGIVPVGTGEAVTDWVEEDGVRYLAIRIRAKSNNVVHRIYPVDIFIETLLDAETLMPFRFTRISREGRRRSNEVTVFDYEKGVARQHNRKRDQHIEFEIEPETRDLVSFMYFIRGETFPVGTQSLHRVMADEKTYDLLIRSIREERVEAQGKKRMRALRLQPDAKFEGLFVHKGQMQVWVTPETPMLILRAEVDIPVARVHMVLEP